MHPSTHKSGHGCLALVPDARHRREQRTERKRKAAANRERVRRAQERRERGVACYQVEIGAGVLDLLVRLG